MKKKILLLSVIFVIMAGFMMMGKSAEAYTSSDFSIDIPSEYKSIGKNVWTKTDGTNINIQVKAHNEKLNKSLDKTLKEIADEVSKLNIYSEVYTKEVTKVSSKKYKCVHIVAKLKSYGTYVEQYEVISDKNIYTITISSAKKDYFTSDEAKSIVKSFEIPNYKEPKGRSIVKNILIYTAIGAISGGVVAGIKYGTNKKKNED